MALDKDEGEDYGVPVDDYLEPEDEKVNEKMPIAIVAGACFRECSFGSHNLVRLQNHATQVQE